MVLWLEDQKIRNYPIDGRGELRKINSNDWNKAFEQYKKDVACPIVSNSPVEVMQWLLSYAVQLEYTDKSN